MTTQTTETTKRRDMHQQVTDTIVKQLEAGVVPWHQPWKGENRILGLPKNATTGKKYRGINILMLWCSTFANDYTTNEWATFKQWQEQKQMIRKGEKGSLIVYYDVMEKDVDGETKEIPFLKSSVVFNRCQLAGYEPAPVVKSDPVDTMERLLHVDTFINNTGAIIEHKGGKACYIPSLDKIWLPEPKDFTGSKTCTAQEAYYSTAFHELTHWTGHETRLNREKSKKFGDDTYAFEELIAELGAAFLCAEFEIGLLPKGDHASYIDHWLKVMQQNKKAIFKATTLASDAVQSLATPNPLQ